MKKKYIEIIIRKVTRVSNYKKSMEEKVSEFMTTRNESMSETLSC